MVVELFRSQILDLRTGGLTKVLSKACTALTLLPSLPIAFGMILLRPLIFLRFCKVRSERIGQFAIDQELYLCKKDLGLIPKSKSLTIFYSITSISNFQIAKMWKRSMHYLPITNPIWVGLMKNLIRWLGIFPSGRDHVFALKDYTDTHGWMERTRPHLILTEIEESHGWHEAGQFGVSKNKPFVCLHSRDSAYLNKALPNQNWNYHSFRDTNVNYLIPAANALSELGYDVVRMGAVVGQELDSAHASKIIDYAAGKRSDFLDVFLLSKCKFGVFTTAGLWTIPAVFRRPIITVNWLGVLVLKTQLFIPKKLWLKSEKRLLTFKEMIQTPIFSFGASHQFEKQGIEVVENTAEEIKDVVLEMHARIDGSWNPSEEDEALNQRFLEIYNWDKTKPRVTARVGRDFLRQNPELLD